MKNVIRFILMLLFGLHIQYGFAQLQGISYSLSPQINYHWVDQNAGTTNGLFGGAQLGIGFGEYVELGFSYQQSFNLETHLKNFDFNPSNAQISNFYKRDVTIKRYGGELKLNLARGALLPYFSIGAGVQSTKADSLNQNDQLYVVPGLGIKLSADDRYTIGFQVLNYNYRFNPAQSLLFETEREKYGLTNTQMKNVSNWALNASLAIYLGGRKPGELSDIDKAYLDQFSSGFQGISIPLEIQASKIDFHQSLPYKDTWMTTVGTGINFGPLIGLRGFIGKALKDKNKFEFDDLTMYGGEVKFKLNEGNGIIPWVALGGGNFYTGKKYSGLSDTITIAKNKGFVSAGLGLEIPFNKAFSIAGFAKTIHTTNQSLDNVARPEEITTSWNYGLSLNFALGKKKKEIEVVKQSAFEEYITTTNIEHEIAKEKLKNEYEEKLKALEIQLEEAVANQDLKAVQEINEQKEQTTKVIEELDKKPSKIETEIEIETEKVVHTTPSTNVSTTEKRPTPSSSYVYMTPEEFRLLLKEILDGLQTQRRSEQIQLDQNDFQYQLRQQNQQLSSYLNQLRSLEVNNEYPARNKQSLLKNSQDTLMDNASNARRNPQVEELKQKLSQLIEHNERLLNHSQSLENPDSVRSPQATDQGLSKQQIESLKSHQEEQIKHLIEHTNQRMDDLEYLFEHTIREINKQNQKNNEANPNNETVIQSVQDTTYHSPWKQKIQYRGMSGFIGFGSSGDNTFNIGYRVHYNIGKPGTKFQFIPESFFGFGSTNTFGINANGVYHLSFSQIPPHIKPYLGAGIGLLNNSNSQLKGVWNLIIGTHIDTQFGPIYIDLTGRNAFKYFQVNLGYKFPF